MAPGENNHYVVVDVGANSTTVLSRPGRIIGVNINTALSAHALPIKDGSTTVFTLPASASAGEFFELWGTRVDSIVVDPDDAATGNITVVYEPLFGAMSDPVA